VRKIVNVVQNVLRVVSELFKAQLKNSECNVFVFAAVVFHESSGSKNLETGTWILSGLLEDGASRLNTFGAASKLHGLYVGLSIFC